MMWNQTVRCKFMTVAGVALRGTVVNQFDGKRNAAVAFLGESKIGISRSGGGWGGGGAEGGGECGLIYA